MAKTEYRVSMFVRGSDERRYVDATSGELVLFRVRGSVTADRTPIIGVCGTPLRVSSYELWLTANRIYKLQTDSKITVSEKCFYGDVEEIYFGIEGICAALNETYRLSHPGIEKHSSWIRGLKRKYSRTLKLAVNRTNGFIRAGTFY